ncbi:PucR family transcriptional regulator [Roseburia sp. MSJ-14]|uniref:PucR family transcriptional regulator n=1 Tax=Roseburia sp. MSJ-14 TaxID=2841514 RepID=UPI001C11AF2F|nr:helix-turn-helix domain-containing protein [Roseburia sp. MSJ-14]MBU5472397.1 helix-turn-helix domain-containing protein [Roseburia sp. MSJ-14]
MLSNHKLQVTLEEIKEISRIDLALYSDKGKLLASTYEEEDMEEAIRFFADSMAESQMLSGCHFFKILIENELEYILLAKATSEEAYMIGRLAVCQIRNMVSAYREQFDRNSFMQNVVLGNMLVVDMYNKAKKLHIEPAQRVVFIIEVSGKKDGIVMETVKNLFVSTTRDFVTEVDEKSVILVKDVRDMPEDEELVELAKMLVDNLHTEAMVKVRVGFGNRVDLLQDITRSYQEARMALEVGSIFYAESDTVSYSKLGIGRLIYQLPTSLCEMFLKEVFGEKVPDGFDEETTVTIQKFFENNLNISETARQLYVHRNTLVYRLERIEKMLGLDIRTFEDAMLFKIALMVISNMNYQKSLIEIKEEE